MPDDPHHDEQIARPGGGDDAALDCDGEADDASASSEVEDMFAGLSHQQIHAVMALMSEPSIERAAIKAATSARTIHRWMQVPAFQRACRIARRHTFQQSIAMMVKYSQVAVSTLVKIMASEQAPEHARVTAASILLRFGRDSIQIDDVAARLDEIEASINAKAQPQRPLHHNGWSTRP